MTDNVGIRDAAVSSDWSYEEHFLPRGDGEVHPIVDQIEEYLKEHDLAKHPFFEAAAHNPGALTLWLSQELVMTNEFSMIVLAAASKVKNVHLRAILAEVAYGEHGRIKEKEATAPRAHPWLLHKLARSINLDGSDIKPLSATLALIERLRRSVDEGTLAALAWIGVGNERLIIPEYSAIERCFASTLKDAVYEPFLQANLKEDKLHSRLCYVAASRLITEQSDANFYYSQAVASIDARWSYFDALMNELPKR